MKLTKTQLKELVKEEVTAMFNESTRRPTDAEHKLATIFAKKKGATLDSIGVDEKTGNINARVTKKGTNIDFILDKRGNIVDIELPF